MSACSVNGAQHAKLEKLYEENSYSEVIIEADKSELIERQDYESLFLLASSYHMTGEHQEAKVTIDDLLTQSDKMKYRILKYNILESLGLYDEQEALISKTLEDYKDKYDDLEYDDKSNYCYWLILNYENEEAIEKYEQLLEELPFNYMKDVLYNNLAWAYLNTYDYEQAKKYSLESLKLAPDDSITLTNLGNSHYGLDEYADAKKAYEDAVEINPNNSYAVYGLANTLDDLDDPESIKHWNRYVELQPYDFDGWYSIYIYYSDSDETDKVVEALEQIIQIEPSYTFYAKELLNVYLNSGDNEKVQETLDNLKLNTTDLEYDLLFAEFTYESLSIEDGFELYLQVLSNHELDYYDLYVIMENLYFNDANVQLEQFLSELEAIYGSDYRLELESELYYEYDEYEKLVEVAKKLINQDSNNAYAYELLGDGYYYLEDYKNAYMNYSQALNIGESTYYLKLSLADCAIYLQDFDEAETFLKELLDENSEFAMVYAYKARIAMLNGDESLAKEMMIKGLGMSEYIDYTLDEYKELESLKNDKDILELISSEEEWFDILTK